MDDLISRQAVLDAMRNNYRDGCRAYSKKLYDVIISLPHVNPKVKTGHWIRQTDDYHDYYECEYCGIAVGLDDIKNYCPNCGAKMVDSQESEDEE